MRPKKRFSQNFLRDEAIITAIIAAFNPRPEDTILEIGPGLGALTQALYAKTEALVAVEVDRDAAAKLRQKFPNLQLFNEDILQFDLMRLQANSIRVIGNLPYHISTPILFHLLSMTCPIQDMLFMLQKEVVARMIAAPNSKVYGRLSVMVQYKCEVEGLFEVPNTAFYPIPEVTSQIVKLVPYTTSPWPAHDPVLFAAIVKQAFSMRRKTLGKSLQGLVSKEKLSDSSLRPENLSVLDFVRLAAG